MGPPPATCEHPWIRWTIHPSPNLCEEESRTGSRFTRSPPPGYLWTPVEGGLAPVLLPTEWPIGAPAALPGRYFPIAKNGRGV